jgi:hypothetical protein
MSVNVVAHPVRTSGIRAVSSPLDIDIAAGCAEDVTLTVRGPIGPDAAATVAELVRALVTTGAVNVIVDLEGSVGPGGDVTRKLGPLGAALRSRGGRLLIAGDGEAMAGASMSGSDLQNAFAAYREITTAASC